MIYYKIDRILRILIMIIGCIPWSGFSQSLVYKEAESLMLQDRFNEALAAYKYLKNEQLNYISLDYRMDICFLMSANSHRKSIDEFMKMYVDFDLDLFYHYWNGKIYLKYGNYKESTSSFEAFLKASKNINTESLYLDRSIETAKNVLKLLNQPVSMRLKAHESPLNTYFAELTPKLINSDRQIVFVSDRLEENSFKVYVSSVTDFGWNAPKSLSILPTCSQSGCMIQTNDTDKVVVYDRETLSLYEVEWVTDQWSLSRTESIPFLSEAQEIYLNKYGNRLLFSFEDSKGKKDLFESLKLRSTGEWTNPTALPGLVNSKYNEGYPFLTEDRTRLYFSSDKPGGLGGMDVYYSEFDNTTLTWGDPVNCGLPINSLDDDVCFRITTDGMGGSLSSNQPTSKGGFDIFTFSEGQQVSVK